MPSVAWRRVSWRAVAGFLALSGIYAFGSGVEASEQASTPPAAQVASPILNADDVDAIVFERQQLMLRLDSDSETLGNIVAGLAPASKLALTTRSIAQGAKEAVESFSQIAPGGRAKPEVWTNHLDFQQRMQAFARNADAMAKAGETGNVNAITEMMVVALPCKECHDLYRQRPKPR